MTGRPGPRRLPSGKTWRKLAGGKVTPRPRLARTQSVAVMDADRIACCNQCKQPLIEIDNRGERLKGCLTCNLWSTVDRKLWRRLSEEDLRALHTLMRHRWFKSGCPGARRPKPTPC